MVAERPSHRRKRSEQRMPGNVEDAQNSPPGFCAPTAETHRSTGNCTTDLRSARISSAVHRKVDNVPSRSGCQRTCAFGSGRQCSGFLYVCPVWFWPCGRSEGRGELATKRHENARKGRTANLRAHNKLNHQDRQVRQGRQVNQDNSLGDLCVLGG